MIRDGSARRSEPSLRWAALALVALGLLAFANALPNPFVWDESFLISDNPLIKAANPLPLLAASFFPPPWEGAKPGYQRYRPLTMLTFWWDYHWWQLRPVGYHLTSVLLHVLNGWLLSLIVGRLTRRPWVGLAVAALWLIHPLQPEAVAYIPSRGTLVAGTGTLLLVWAHLAWRQRGALTGRWLAVEMAAYGLALGSMEAALVAPGLVWLYERTARARDGSLRDGSARRSEPSLSSLAGAWRREAIGLGLVLLVYLAARAHWCPIGGIQWTAAWLPRLQLFGQTMATYTRWLLWPAEIRFPIGIDETFPWWSGVVWLAVYGVATWQLWARPVRPGWSHGVIRFGWLWFLWNLAPMSNLGFPVGPPIAAHLIYVPAMGIALAAGTLAADLLRRVAQSRRGRALVLCGVGTLGIWWFRQTLAFNALWGDRVALYHAWIRAGPPFTARGYEMLATHYVTVGLHRQQLKQSVEAGAAYRMAIWLDPTSAPAYNNLAVLAIERRAFAEAEALARRAIEVAPDFAEAYGNLSEALWHQGQPEAALQALTRAMALQPDNPEFQRSYQRKASR